MPRACWWAVTFLTRGYRLPMRNPLQVHALQGHGRRLEPLAVFLLVSQEINHLNVLPLSAVQ